MFGYVKPYKPTLTVGDYDFYRAVYCGVCRSMKQQTGFLSPFSLNYDLVFLALVRLLVGENRVQITHRRCGAHPFHRRAMVTANAATDYAGRINAILAYYKLQDDRHDKRALGKLPATLAIPAMSHARRLANLPTLDEKIATHLAALAKAEHEKIASVDIPAGIFGALLGDIFAYDVPSDYREALWSLGDTVGKFVYAADAAEDFAEDVKQGNYNPYILTWGTSLTNDNRRAIHDALLCTLAQGEIAWQSLPFGNTVTVRRLIENILYDGLPRRIDFLINSNAIQKNKATPYDGMLP